ncbi:Lrp/AsnC family transcriptional regulator [Granulosicoccaceae sp. 1_MG-2023]|nr:Lrp/AsnC family transcriptional regulator [Granulosicoccaceae sp. 1_MG-2023]
MGSDKQDSSSINLDKTDLAILKRLQQDGRLSNARLAEEINLSETPCWRRWKSLESNGFIEEYRAVISPRKLGFTVTAFTQVSFSSHDLALTDAFESIVNDLDWVQSCHCITGNMDYLLQMVFRDLDEFSERINVIRRIPGVRAIETQIAVKAIKSGSHLPIE